MTTNHRDTEAEETNSEDPRQDELDPGLNDLTERVIGACIEVHQNLGPGFLESVYEEAVAIELTERDIPYARQATVGVDYKNRRIGEQRIDFLVDGRLVVELKAVELLSPLHKAQVLSYLKATGLRLGLLVNFKVSRLTYGVKRVAL